MKYFKVLLECGHVGAGRSHEVVRYFEAENMLVLLDRLKTLPRLKRKGSFVSIKSVTVVSRASFLEGRNLEGLDPYLSRFGRGYRRFKKDFKAPRFAGL